MKPWAVFKEELKQAAKSFICNHVFFRCNVGGYGPAVYHQVCEKCRLDATVGIIMPVRVWRNWVIPQLERAE